jgi:hypothetical protein
MCTELFKYSCSQIFGPLLYTEQNFKHHIKTICTRVSRALYMLRIPKNPLLLYRVHCHLVYCNQIWGCANASLITELYRKQKAAVRIIFLANYLSL